MICCWPYSLEMQLDLDRFNIETEISCENTWQEKRTNVGKGDKDLMLE